MILSASCVCGRPHFSLSIIFGNVSELLFHHRCYDWFHQAASFWVSLLEIHTQGHCWVLHGPLGSWPTNQLLVDICAGLGAVPSVGSAQGSHLHFSPHAVWFSVSLVLACRCHRGNTNHPDKHIALYFLIVTVPRVVDLILKVFSTLIKMKAKQKKMLKNYQIPNTFVCLCWQQVLLIRKD